jgi:hypothetical protein
VAKAEHLNKGANPRFVVTSWGAEQIDTATVGSSDVKLTCHAQTAEAAKLRFIRERLGT